MRTRLPRAERERQALDAARALFAERGYADVTMDEVAAAVGVTKPLLYNYFGNKDRLFLECMRPAGDALMEAVLGAVQSAHTPQEALRGGIHAFFAFLEAERDAWRVLYDPTLPVGGAVAQRVAEHRDQLERLVSAALLELTQERASEPLSVAILGAAEALGRWWLRTGAMPASKAAELLIHTFEPGLNP